MDFSEFKVRDTYLKTIKNEKGSFDANTFSNVKSKEFYTIMASFINKHSDKYMYRDFLDTDKTFGIIVPKYSSITLTESIGLYLDTKDILSAVTYSKVKNTGFIDLGTYVGFWVLLE